MRLEAPPRRRARIALTPLIDVVFILLLFFMLTTRFGQQQATPLRMPGNATAAASLTQQRVVLRLGAAGAIALPNGTTLALQQLDGHPELRRIRTREFPVSLAVDDEVPLQVLVSALEALEAAGVVDVVVRGLR